VWFESAGVQLMFELPDAGSLRVGDAVGVSLAAEKTGCLASN